MNAGIILSGGNGQRFRAETPKQYRVLCGKEIIAYSIDAMSKAHSIDETIVVTSPEYINVIKEEYGVCCIPGGATRNESIALAIEHVNTYHPKCERILFNDAVRPFLTAEIVNRYIMLLNEYDAVYTAQHILDSIGMQNQQALDKSLYHLIQAPEAFRFQLLKNAFDKDAQTTDPAQQMPESARIHRYYGFNHNIKITYPEDIAMSEGLMQWLNQG